MLGFLVGASETDKCPMCKHRFKYGLLKKLKEGENLHKHFLGMLNMEFLVHLKTTHGLDPEDVERILI